MKKMAVTGLAVLAVIGISIPVIASGLQGKSNRDEIQIEAEIEEAEMKAAGDSAVITKLQPQMTVASCEYYVDANGDGVCDHCVAGEAGRNACASYVDADGDGVCDHCVAGEAGRNACASYVDADGDGVCDHCVTGGSGRNGCNNYVDANQDRVCDYREANNQVRQSQGRHHGGGHHGGRHH